MSLIDTTKFNPLALEWLLQHIEFNFDNDGSKSLIEGLPCIVCEQAGGMWLYRWKLPLTGDSNADFLLALEMGIGFIKALEYESVGDLDPAPDSMAGIFEAMRRGLLSVSSDHVLGFYNAVESFIECAINHPVKFEQLRTRLRHLTADDLRERCKCILSGGVPPDIFFNDAI